MGWVVQSHGALYASEYGLDSSFEALVAEIAAKFLTSFDASRERCWIAELDGVPVGSVFLVKHSDDVAKLRLLLVDPAGARPAARPAAGRRMRRLRAGDRLSQDDAVDPEHPGRRAQIYQDAGFKLVATEPHRSFGQSLVGETWEREL